MALVEIIQFRKDATPATQGNQSLTEKAIHEARNVLKDIKIPGHVTLGIQVQDPSIFQITSEWNGTLDHEELKANSEHTAFLKSVRSSFAEPQNMFRVAFKQPAFGPTGPATANVVEFVQIWFPASRVTPEYQEEIERDFIKFDHICKRAMKGDMGLAFGWVLEEQEHEDIKDEKAKCFFVARGWESMEYFERLVKDDAYKEAIPLLLAWSAPFKIVRFLLLRSG